MTELFVTAVAVIAGATAAVAGFGIGSLLTPTLAIWIGTKLAVSAVAIPHFLATALRCWRLRRDVDGRVLRTFGLVSAAGGLAGALLHARLGSRAVTIALGVLLLATAVAALTDIMRRVAMRGALPWIAGALSGLFGGVAGNQGGLRAAAMLPFGLRPAAFVGTATAIALLVDLARLPVYVYGAAGALADIWPLIAFATAGALVGTLLGERILLGLTPGAYRKVLGSVIGIIGVLVLAEAL